MKKNLTDKVNAVYTRFIDNKTAASPPELIFMRLKNIIMQETGNSLTSKQKELIKPAFNVILGIQRNIIKLQPGYQAISRIIENVLDPTYKQHSKKSDAIQDHIDQQYLF